MQSLRLLLVSVGIVLGAASTQAAETYALDADHSSITFMIQHLGISFVHGRFNEFAGTFTIDKDKPDKSSFEMTIKAGSIDTNQKKRDEHLRSKDFFDVAKYPDMTFKSTKVEATKAGYKVTGDFTMHGVTKAITFELDGGKTIEVKGQKRTGIATAFILKRADFGISFLPEGIANDVNIFIGFEGKK